MPLLLLSIQFPFWSVSVRDCVCVFYKLLQPLPTQSIYLREKSDVCLLKDFLGSFPRKGKTKYALSRSAFSVTYYHPIYLFLHLIWLKKKKALDIVCNIYSLSTPECSEKMLLLDGIHPPLPVFVSTFYTHFLKIKVGQ